MDDPSESFVYQVTHSDGVEFEQVVDSIDTLRNVHASVQGSPTTSILNLQKSS